MAPSTPLLSLATTTDEGNRRHNRSDENEGFLLDNEIDLDSLQWVFGSSPPEEFRNRKAHELRELFLAKANETRARSVPRFLLDPKNKDHVPPHAVALQVLLRLSSTRRAGSGDGLYRRVDARETETDRSDRDNNERLPNDDDREAEEEEEGPPSAVGPVLGTALVGVAHVALVSQFVLEVLGGAGAIWGCAELVGLRKGGPVDPSWWVTTVAAVAVGAACLVRFLLVHPFFVGDTHPTFAQKHKLRALLLLLRNTPNHTTARGCGPAIELVRIVAGDPVLFLHPTKGPALVSVCCCYCVCVRPGGAVTTGGNPPASLGTDAPSPRRSTWDASDDDDVEDDDNDGRYGFDALSCP